MSTLSRVPFRSLVHGPTRRSTPSFGALILASGIAPMALDTYMPAMPQMAVSLHTSAAVIQLTVTGYIIGMAAGQLLSGPVSDAVGRRPLLLAPAVVFTVAAVVCATAASPGLLVATRLVHGMAAGATVACGRAVVSDRYRGGDLATRFGTLTAITQVGPVIAPGLGSVVIAAADWRAIFWFMAALGAVMVAWIALGVPETLPPAQRHPAGLAATGKRMATLARDWNFSQHVAVMCLVIFGFFIYIGGSSFVLQRTYGISQSAFSLLFSVNAALMIVGSLAYRLLVSRYGPARLRAVAVGLATVAALALLSAAQLSRPAPPPFALTWLLLAVATGSMGLFFPATSTLAQEAGMRARGTASSLQGGLSMLAGAIASPLTGLFGDDSLLPTGILMTAGFTAGAVLLVVVSRRRAGAGRAGAPWQAVEPGLGVAVDEPADGVGGARR